MKSYEYFDHTADTLFRAYGKTFDQALGNLVLAVYNVIVETKTVKSIVEKKFVVESKAKESLVYDVMDEIVLFLDTESFLCSSVNKVLVEKTAVGFRATIDLSGDTKASDYDVFGQIKSATYHELEIGEEKGYVFIQAVLDL